MCQFSEIVRLDTERYATYCEHGNVSVTWYGCTFHIHAAEFAPVVGLFAAGQGAHQHFILDRCSDKWGQVKWAFWSRNACLLLSPSEAKELLALLRQAQDAVVALQAHLSPAAGGAKPAAQQLKAARLLH